MSISPTSARRGRPRGSEAPELLSIARQMFIARGYRGTTMDAVAAQAHISKQSLYRDYPSKGALYSAVVRDWVDRGYDAMRPHTTALAETRQARQGLLGLARVLQAGLLSPPVLQMRTLIAAEAHRFPDVAADYVTRSWTRNIGILAKALGVLTARGLLRIEDPDLAAEQLTWLVVAAPLNRLTLQAGAHPYRDDELQAIATQGVNTFMSRYGPEDTERRAVPYDPTIYLGSAAHYRYGRPAYSPDLEAVLTQETGLDGTGRLLDAGCGPGVLTIRLAHLFEQAVGLDPDAGMLAEGCRAAEEKGVINIRWVQGLAEDLPAIAPGPYKLVTFGQSFHWTDEQQVAETVYDMLEPGGALALIVHTVTGRPRPRDPGVPPIPHDEIKALVAKYLGSTRRAGQGTVRERTHRFEDVLVRTRFGVPQQLFVPGIPDLLRDSESVLSGYLSLSSSAPHLFGDRLDDFAGEVRALLASRSAEGTFWDWPGDTEVILARKRG